MEKNTYTLTSFDLSAGLESIFFILAIHEFALRMPPDKSDAEFALDNSSSSLLELSAPPAKNRKICVSGTLDPHIQ